MAYEIARAYDSDKNLVPLYVMSDGEIWNNYPETVNAFTFTYNNDHVGEGNTDQSSTFSVSATGINPVGYNKFNGNEDVMFEDNTYPLFKASGGSSTYVGRTISFTIINDTAVSIRFIWTVGMYEHNGALLYSLTNEGSSVVIPASSQETITSTITAYNSTAFSGGGDCKIWIKTANIYRVY